MSSPLSSSLRRWHAANFAFGSLLFLTLYHGSRLAYRSLLSVRRAVEIRVPGASSSSPSSGATTSASHPFASASSALDAAAAAATAAAADADVPEFFTQSTEDAISEETLGELAFGAHADLSEAARRLVVDRVTRSPTVWATLLANIEGGRGREAQEAGLVALRYLYARTDLPRRERTLRALVRFMMGRLEETRGRWPSGGSGGGGGADQQGQEEYEESDTDWRLRSQGERDAMWILRREAEMNAELLLDATPLVERWLARYPFGGPGLDGGVGAEGKEKRARRREVVQRLLDGLTDDDQMFHLLTAIYFAKNALGRRRLRAAGLIESVLRDRDVGAEGGGGGGGAAAGFDAFGEPVVGGVGDGVTLYAPLETPGDHEGEDPEARLRRRRRNTVVAEPSSRPEEEVEVEEELE